MNGDLVRTESVGLFRVVDACCWAMRMILENMDVETWEVKGVKGNRIKNVWVFFSKCL